MWLISKNAWDLIFGQGKGHTSLQERKKNNNNSCLLNQLAEGNLLTFRV